MIGRIPRLSRVFLFGFLVKGYRHGRLYGMTLAHLHTGNTKYLEAAKCCAHYFIANTVATGYVPLCDFRAPLEPVIYDTSAGAIAASGLLALSRQVAAEEKEMYTDAAIKILKALDEKHCNWDTRTDSLWRRDVWLITAGRRTFH